MNCKSSLLLVALTLLAVQVTIEGKELSQEKLRKSYEKINKYLEKHVPHSDDPQLNMAEAENLLDRKSSQCFLLGGKSLVDSLKLLKDFSTLPSDSITCDPIERRKLMEEVELGLSYDERISKTPDYELSRVEKIIQYYAFETALRCKFDRKFPRMEYGFKQRAYSEINSRLMVNLPEVEDIDTNMAKVEELLKELGSKDGALASALKQLLLLKSTLNKETCNMEGYKILYKNDLATRGKVHKWNSKPTRRVDKIFEYYARKHQQLCREIFRQKFKVKLEYLDRDTYLKVLGLASSRYLDIDQYSELMDELNNKKFDSTLDIEHFSVPLMDEFARNTLPRYINFVRLEPFVSLKTKNLYHYIKALSGAAVDDYSPEFNYFNLIIDLKTNLLNENKVKFLLNKYLFTPCHKYLSVYEDLVDADKYSSNIDDGHMKSSKEDFVDDITYHMVRAGYYACKYIRSGEKSFTESIIQQLKNNWILNQNRYI